MPCKPNIHPAKFDPPCLFKILTRPRQYYWHCDGLALLAKMCSASPIRRDNAYSKSCNKRKRKYSILQRKCSFKFKITPDRHNAIQNLNYCLLPDPPLSSLPSTFKTSKIADLIFFFSCYQNRFSCLHFRKFCQLELPNSYCTSKKADNNADVVHSTRRTQPEAVTADLFKTGSLNSVTLRPPFLCACLA